jgi:hypothetical protein
MWIRVVYSLLLPLHLKEMFIGIRKQSTWVCEIGCLYKHMYLCEAVDNLQLIMFDQYCPFANCTNWLGYSRWFPISVFPGVEISDW